MFVRARKAQTISSPHLSTVHEQRRWVGKDASMLNLLAAEQVIYDFKTRFGDSGGSPADKASRNKFHDVLGRHFSTAPDVDLVRLRSVRHLTWHQQRPDNVDDSGGGHQRDGGHDDVAELLVAGARQLPPSLWESPHQYSQRGGDTRVEVRCTPQSHSQFLFDDRCEALAAAAQSSPEPATTHDGTRPTWHRALVPLDVQRTTRSALRTADAPWRNEFGGNTDGDDAAATLANDAYVRATLYDANPSVLQGRDGGWASTREGHHRTQQVLGHSAYGAVGISDTRRRPSCPDDCGGLLGHLRSGSCPTATEEGASSPPSIPQWMTSEVWHTMPSAGGSAGSMGRGTMLDVVSAGDMQDDEDVDAARRHRRLRDDDVMDYKAPVRSAAASSPRAFSPFMRRRHRNDKPSP